MVVCIKVTSVRTKYLYSSRLSNMSTVGILKANNSTIQSERSG